MMYLHNIVPMQAAHAAKFSRQQPFRRKFMMSEQEKCVQKIGRNVLHINMIVMTSNDYRIVNSQSQRIVRSEVR